MAFRGKRFRTHPTARRSGKLHPAAIVAICLCGAVLLTVVAGNLLRLWVDDDTYARLTEGETEAVPPVTAPAGSMRVINAYPYALGTDIASIVAMPAASVAINTPDGTVCYTSPVVQHLSLPCDETVVLQEAVMDLSAIVPYISGVFYPQALAEPSPDVRHAKSVAEAALVREFLRTGGSEAVLCGLPVTTANIDAVCEYLTAVKSSVGSASVGVAVPYATATDPDAWELLARLEQVCDFFALDLRGAPLDPDDLKDNGISPSAEALLRGADYFLATYPARLLLSDDQTSLRSTLEAKVYPNFQIVHGE